jgi:ribosomal protein S18 acetylase RimI-like enzyme
VIRRGVIADADALAEVNARAWWAAYGAFVEHDKIAAELPGLAEGWRRALSDAWRTGREVWVHERDGVLAGWATVGPSRDPDARAGDGELWSLYVAPECMGRGDGHALLVHAEARLAKLGFRGATLWVFDENTVARRFYERHGWTLDDRPGANPWADWGPCVRYRKEYAEDDPS